MAIVGTLLEILAGSLEVIGNQFRRVSSLLYGVLPALLSPTQLLSGVRTCYSNIYSERLIPWATLQHDELETWEADVLDRYPLRSGRMLVLGSGWGRESLAMARRGLTVVGIDTNEIAVRTAQRAAHTAGVSASFHRASFLDLPYHPKVWDHVLMAATMYSAVPSSSWRKRLLKELVRVLKPNGLLILSFLAEQRPISRVKVVSARVSSLLVKLPRTSQTYEAGDSCIGGHFLHAFQDEAEISRELHEAGVLVQEINWYRGFAVVTAPSPLPEPHPLRVCRGAATLPSRLIHAGHGQPEQCR
jgi:ubiquinone/menaquinone biosynthesis C-methylase UbiE